MSTPLRLATVAIATLVAMCCLRADAEERELIRDPHFQQGFIALKAQTGRRVPYGTLAGLVHDTQPIWDLAQWSSKHALQLAPPRKLTGGAIEYANASKSVTVGKPGSSASDIVLAVNGSVEYGTRARQKGEPWVHLLLQQKIVNPPALADITSAHFHIEARLKTLKKIDTSDYSPGRHAAQFQVFFSIQNRNPQSAGHGQYLWFGVPLFDDRHEFPKAHKSKDTAGTNMFIFTPAGGSYTTQSAHSKQWITVDKDLLPLMREGLELAWKRGFLRDSKSFDDYRIAGMNIGWEVPGIFDVKMQVRNLSLIVQ